MRKHECCCYGEAPRGWSSSRHAAASVTAGGSRGAGGRRRDAGTVALLVNVCVDLFSGAASLWVLERLRFSRALDSNATHELACRKPGNSPRAGERDFYWTNAGFSAGFWAVQVEWYGFSLKSAPRLGRSARARLRVATRLSSLAFCRPAFYRKAKAMLDCL